MTGPLDQIRPGEIVGFYEIIRPLRKGEAGGMSRIFEARLRDKYRKRNSPRRVALKIGLEEYQDALKAEADYLGRFDHPNVVKVFPMPHQARPIYVLQQKFEFGWFWYYAMELITGGSLQQYLNRPTAVTHLLRPAPTGVYPRSLVQVMGIAYQILAALEHIHERHVINLDIKPGNILIRKRSFRFWRSSVPEVVLVDFGISRDLRYPRIGVSGIATPEYMSPEQAQASGPYPRLVDATSDIFSLGVTLYELLTGQLPFNHVGETLDPDFSATPLREIRPSIPPELERVIMRALAKEPQYRYSSASELREALDRVKKPVDWWLALRRVASLSMIVAGLGLGPAGCERITDALGGTPTPQPTEEIAPTSTRPSAATATFTSITPTFETPSSTPRSTSTPRPTNTPTPVLPPTLAATPVEPPPTQAP